MSEIYNRNNMSGLGKTLVDLLIPNTKRYYGSLVFDAYIIEFTKVIKFRLTTIYRDWDYDKKYIKSRSQMNVSELRKAIKEALRLGPKDLLLYQIGETKYSEYNHTYTREAELVYKLTDKLINELQALEAITTKGCVKCLP